MQHRVSRPGHGGRGVLVCCLLGAVVASAAPTIESSNGEITLSVGAVNDLAGGVFVQEVDADGRALGDRQRLVTEDRLLAMEGKMVALEKSLREDIAALTLTTTSAEASATAARSKLGQTLKAEIDEVLTSLGKLETKQRNLTETDRKQAACHASGKIYDAGKGACVLAVQVSCGDTLPAAEEKNRKESYCAGSHFYGEQCTLGCKDGYSAKGGADQMVCGLDGNWAPAKTGISTCANVDECAVGDADGKKVCAGAGQKCVDVPGAYVCKCPNNHILNPSTGDCQISTIKYDFASGLTQGWQGTGLWGPSVDPMDRNLMPSVRATSTYGKLSTVCTTSCGTRAPQLKAILGGKCAAAGTRLFRMIELPKHRQLVIKFSFVAIDTWDGETALLQLNGKEIWRKVYKFNREDALACPAAGRHGLDILSTVEITVAHVQTDKKQVQLQFRTLMDNGPYDESWGIGSVEITPIP